MGLFSDYISYCQWRWWPQSFLIYTTSFFSLYRVLRYLMMRQVIYSAMNSSPLMGIGPRPKDLLQDTNKNMTMTMASSNQALLYNYPDPVQHVSTMQHSFTKSVNTRARWFSKKFPNLFGQKCIIMSDWIIKENMKIRSEKWIFTLA